MTWQPNKLEAERLEKLQRLRERGIDPFPGSVQRTHTIAQAISAFIEQEGRGEAAEPIDVSICGRLRAIRSSGKLSFAHVEDGTGKVQLFIRQDNVGEETYTLFKRELDLFDFVQADGVMMRTRTGEISVDVRRLRVLAKALSPLPVVKEQEVDGKIIAHGGFTDVEERYRQRYADLAVNPEVREVFRKRAQTISAVRRFLDSEGFLEVETPILQAVYGGAAARPFITHHNQLKQDLYLRISFELYLKRLLVGMYDAVYEIGRDFRNEGVSFKHNPEFTMLEFYKAYIDYNGGMSLTERLIAYVAEQVHGSTQVTYNGNLIELAPPWRRVTLRQAIREACGIDYMDYPTAEALYAAICARNIPTRPNLPWGKYVEQLMGDFVEPNLIQPTFILDYPRDISPFAKGVPGDPFHVQRFEFYIGGMELGNAFTELNDPLDQEQRFLEMARLFREGDDDEAPLDEDYLRAMRYGMPPNGGVGVGIDRLVMLMTDRHTIREVLLYPHLRERDKE
ncbi:MAG: lysine--tRNA ligase [Candidatus Thermofonsia Clade 1 bacterium]|jgi:lysyl-tRNA synthetase class 2|uniref:Lysine--tRNA ligase n=1 Tax=Candidatus Thermofonsia Clade 1 bacterium TaxID=2364210 RepID=A0A2M8PF74_9CHLR|nr:MAG: lysine--tRNA ligase [Candidatus Thermofonsia Clade 1 bacterium]